MSERRPAVRFTQPGADALDRTRAREHQLEGFPLLHGAWAAGTFASGSSLLRAKHKLGRAYVGATAFMYTEGAGLTAGGLVCIAPELARKLAATPPLDPEIEVYLRRSDTAAELPLRFWVF